jgi:hypothetical protein
MEVYRVLNSTEGFEVRDAPVRIFHHIDDIDNFLAERSLEAM